LKKVESVKNFYLHLVNAIELDIKNLPMKKIVCIIGVVFFVLSGGYIFEAYASRLIGVKVIDRDYLLVYFKDGDVTFVDDGKGEGAYRGHYTSLANSQTVRYGSALNLQLATKTTSWTLKSDEDPNYAGQGFHPTRCYRKSKLNGMSEEEWLGDDYRYEHTMKHYIYLKLPRPLKQGKTYNLQINEKTHTNTTSEQFTFDIFKSRSGAIHVNLVGYPDDPGVKAVDVYHFMGDGGSRDYSAFEGNPVYLYNVTTGKTIKVGTVSFWHSQAKEASGYDLTGSDVWKADFTGYNKPGTYRVAIEGIGCSQDFTIQKNVYRTPFQVCLQGYFYMRIGQDSGGIRPVPRRPLWIPNEDPPDCKVYITSLQPYHPEWSRGAWDNPNEFVDYIKAGHPTNPDAWGGHSDALDWDRHLGHVSNIYDLLFSYFITDGAISDDDTGIAESDNGIPDILDEARNEVDFWLRLRDGKAYSHGLTNPNDNNILYQAGTSAMAAWANALNCSMLASCFKIAGMKQLEHEYTDSALAAYRYAADRRLNQTGPSAFIRGIDYKMMSAAYLYNLTGNEDFEDNMKNACVVSSDRSQITIKDSLNQLWGIAAYLLTDREVNYQELQDQMKASIIYQARNKEIKYSKNRPSRRATDNSTGYFWTRHDVHRTILAHAIAEAPDVKAACRDALLLEAGWGLGRNPLNMIYMTTATTSLQSINSVENIYTSGRDDGTPGLHPGHTPYLNHDDWGSMIMARPGWLTSKCYPDFSQWPKAEGYFNTRYVWAHSEFTPRQTMRGKLALYAYLYGISGK
jgi:hypothetical protein